LILQAHHFLAAVMKTNGRHGAPNIPGAAEWCRADHTHPVKVCHFAIRDTF
jgi:hypothetical protein